MKILNDIVNKKVLIIYKCNGPAGWHRDYCGYKIGKIVEYNIENNVLFIEPTKEINKFYSAFDIFLFPSLYEGLPLVLVEAQCASLKIIMSSNIPNEVIFVPKLITKVSLSNLDLWVKEAANYKNINKNDVYDLYIKSPFSIKNLVKNIELIYSK